MADHHPLYFIALLPPEEIQEEVRQFKLEAKERFGSERALRSPAHITLWPPFRYADERLPHLKDTLKEFAYVQQPFPLTLKDFAAFKPRVIYVDVLESTELSKLYYDLRKHLHLETDLEVEEPQRPFHPHMTVAFRDLERERFPEAWEHFSQQRYERTFTANRFALLRYRKNEWHVESEFLFRKEAV